MYYSLGPPVKQGAALLLGLIISIATCGIHTLHSLCTVLGTWLIIKINWRLVWNVAVRAFTLDLAWFPCSTFVLVFLFRSAPALSLGWTFLYLLFFRLVTWFGLPQPTPFANAIQLLLTLKVRENEIRLIFHVLNSWYILDEFCFECTDGQFSQWDSKLSLGEKKGSEHLHQILSGGRTFPWAFTLWRYIIQLLLCGHDDRYFACFLCWFEYVGMLLSLYKCAVLFGLHAC